ncbi:MAG TPA: hypothetical protein VGO61_13280 [Steroidobacteraceae bacterium]|jgi:hypothetical protein|nr:hypothetical protein [Steroidobacteraceae bacterium]
MLVLAMPAACSHAADGSDSVSYVPPPGFGGHAWGELRTSAGFDRLPTEPVGVGAGWIRPVEKDFDYTCVIPPPPPGPILKEAVPGCKFDATLLRMRKSFEGGGFYVLSEYSIPEQAFRFGDEKDGVVLYPVIYQFCANWDETKRNVPPKFDEMNKFCGVRLMFKTDTREQLRKHPAEYVPNYDRVLERMIEKFGYPANFARRGQVVIETLEGDSTNPVERKFSIWRWCPARDRAFHTTCTASVTLALDPGTGVATVLYSTPLLWEFAYARENNGYKGDKLFKMLHARK